MLRRPPSATLVPYTTLFRSPDDQVQSYGWRLVFLSSVVVTIAAYVFRRKLRESPVFEEAKARGKIVERQRTRSEEHTSELQSRENLVCRLLLEKKNVGLEDG